MAAKKYTMKNFNGTDWDILYPKTTADQVIEDQNRQFISAEEKGAIANILEDIDADTLDGLHADDFLQVTSQLDATKLTGVIPLSSIPPAAVERLVIVQDKAARFALTTETVQTGDTVKEVSTGQMYYVKDDTQLSSEEGYEEYAVGSAASVPWSGITNTPDTLAGYGITDAATKAVATTSANGLMSATDKAKIDDLPRIVINDTEPTEPAIGTIWFDMA